MGFFDKLFAPSGATYSPAIFDLANGPYFYGNGDVQFQQVGNGYSLVTKLGLEKGDIFLFDNQHHSSSLIVINKPGLGEGEVGLQIMGQLVAKLDVDKASKVYSLLEKNGGIAAVESSIKNDGQVRYMVDLAVPKMRASSVGRNEMPPMLRGTFSSAVEVDTNIGDWGKENFEDFSRKVPLEVGSSAVVIGLIYNFTHGQSQNSVRVCLPMSVGEVDSPGEKILISELRKNGMKDNSGYNASAWLVLTKTDKKKQPYTIQLIADAPFKIA